MKLQEEIKELESTVEKCEEDRTTKDSQIRTLRDEIAHQEDMIVKLGKEKKSAGEGRQKTEVWLKINYANIVSRMDRIKYT